MNIALMTNNYKPVMGGVPISIERLAKGLRDLGHKVTIFAPSYGDTPKEEGVFRYKTLIKHFYGGTVVPNSFDPAIIREFKTHRYDVIHVHHPVLIGDMAVYLSKRFDIPLTFTYHTRYEQYLSYAGIIRSIENASKKNGPVGSVSGKVMREINEKVVPSYISSFARKCDYVFAPTDGMKDYLHFCCDIPRCKIGVLPTGLEKEEYREDPDEVSNIRRQYIKNGEYLFVSVSRIAHEKNIAFLIEAVKRLKTKTDIPFKLLMIGEGPERENLKKACDSEGLKEIDFIGQVPNPEIRNYCRAADAFLFASKSETQGIVIIEALAVGTPVIAVDATGVRDVVISGVNGILTNDDVYEFTDSIYSFMRGEINIDDFSKEAVETALEFSEESVARRAESAYAFTIGKRNGRKVSHGRKISYLAG